MAEVLRRVAAALSERREELAQLITREAGIRPLVGCELTLQRWGKGEKQRVPDLM